MNATEYIAMVDMLHTSVATSTACVTIVSIAGPQFTRPQGHRTIAALSRRTEIDQELSASSQPSDQL